MPAALVLLAAPGASGAMGLARVIPLTAKNIKPETAIEKAIPLIAVLPCE